MNKLSLDMNNISIEFPGVKALNNVNFTAEGGKVQAIVGANGAGKSTLMKILAGAYNYYTGDIFIDGKKENIKSPIESKKLGIQVVYQEVDTVLIPYLTVSENILLDSIVNNMGKKLFVNWKEINLQAKSVLQKLNIDIPINKYVNELTLAEKQMVLIARAISKHCRLLILDEPTAPLSYAETEELFSVVKDLKSKNVGVIFISHRLPEVFQICDEVTVMRDGKIVAKRKVNETTQNEIVEDMLGRKLKEDFPERKEVKGKKIFEVINLKDENKLKNIDLFVRKGEIVGLVGLVGAGKTELCKAMFGETRIKDGNITLDGKKLLLRNTHDAVKSGLALIPEERRKEGILANESIVINNSSASLEKFTRPFGFLDFEKEKKAAIKTIESLGIKTPDEKREVGLLSGGNQQKIVIGKWLDTDTKVYIFDEPTKGVDIGAKRDIFNLIDKLAKDGKGIIYASCELSEVMGIADRIYIIYDGKIVKEIKNNNISQEELMFYCTGGVNYVAESDT
ncbi:MAG TPA: sugar ABC transporter ATP-binding protein [Clostridium sp.]